MDNYKEIIFVIVSAMLLNYAYNKFPLLTFKEGMTPSIDIEGDEGQQTHRENMEGHAKVLGNLLSK